MVASLSHLQNVRTLAFEPASGERDWLCECLARYPDWNVEVVPLGLSDSEVQTSLRLAGGRSTLRQDWYQSQRLDEETIGLTRLDAYASKHGIGRIRLWKLDVEGHEVIAVKGAQQLLAGKSIDAILLECQTSTIPALLEQLTPAGYSLFRLVRSRLVPLNQVEWERGFEGNLIALPIPE